MNLLKETLNILNKNRLKQSDVLWCGSVDFGYFTWQDFKDLANTDYHNRSGLEVATDIVIVTKKGYLERHNYDGSEWWEYKEIPKMPKNYRKPIALTDGQADEFRSSKYDFEGETLADLNKKTVKKRLLIIKTN